MRNPLRHLVRRWQQRRFRIRPRTPDAPAVAKTAPPAPPVPLPPAAAQPPVIEPAPAATAPVPANVVAKEADAETVAKLAQPVLDRLAEDETLRGELTDAGFMPLLGWLSRLTTSAAQRAAVEDDREAAMERVADAALRLGRAIVRAAEHGDTSGLAAALASPLLTPDDAPRAAAAVATPMAGATPDERAQALVAALDGATSA